MASKTGSRRRQQNKKDIGTYKKQDNQADGSSGSDAMTEEKSSSAEGVAENRTPSRPNPVEPDQDDDED